MPVSVCQRRKDTLSIAPHSGLPMFKQLWLGFWGYQTTRTFTSLCVWFFFFFILLSLSLFLSLSLSLSLSVDVIVRRCGGGFGAKISRSNLTAAVCALGAYATKR